MGDLGAAGWNERGDVRLSLGRRHARAQARDGALSPAQVGDHEFGVADTQKEIGGQYSDDGVGFAVQDQALGCDVGRRAESLPILMTDHGDFGAEIGAGQSPPEAWAGLAAAK
jgi:hypothetical protein